MEGLDVQREIRSARQGVEGAAPPPVRELDSIGDRIRAFHAGVRGDEAFAAAQEHCLRTYREVLAPFPFTQRLPRLLAPWLRVPDASA